MSQFVETRVGDFLGRLDPAPRPVVTTIPRPVERSLSKPAPEPVIKSKEVGPAKLSPEQIFTF